MSKLCKLFDMFKDYYPHDIKERRLPKSHLRTAVDQPSFSSLGHRGCDALHAEIGFLLAQRRENRLSLLLFPPLL